MRHLLIAVYRMATDISESISVNWICLHVIEGALEANPFNGFSVALMSF